ncbi:hypothetical protein G6O69_12760 [Pseudenhygromyxa sp. WMMC2535]|uniref:hypothetical protein n=1 Tax=Pseudenhygromyxa sp. WMMC2535 TaxID=2712867 RepID=UPI001556D2E5|nr:hypothetical protein [Pseudenhygromyxa sp. WMMC2535]NVB38705.1 hypothetical protein [Pseudenhygromyxa sp. WMMC2535]
MRRLAEVAQSRLEQPLPQPRPETERLEQVLAEVREDAQRRPGDYQGDTRVPAGGE